AGDLFRFPAMGDALEAIAQEGAGWLYDSDVTRELCNWVCERGGMMSPADFTGYEVVERTPVEAQYRNRRVLTNAPPSSGGILIAHALRTLEARGTPPPLEDPEAL